MSTRLLDGATLDGPGTTYKVPDQVTGEPHLKATFYPVQGSTPDGATMSAEASLDATLWAKIAEWIAVPVASLFWGADPDAFWTGDGNPFWSTGDAFEAVAVRLDAETKYLRGRVAGAGASTNISLDVALTGILTS